MLIAIVAVAFLLLGGAHAQQQQLQDKGIGRVHTHLNDRFLAFNATAYFTLYR